MIKHYNTMALSKVHKSIALLVEETAIETLSEVAKAMQEKFNIAEDEVESFITEYKTNLVQKVKQDSKKPGAKKNAAPKEKRAPSEYNIFIKNALIRLKKENPETPAKELMGKAAAEWKASKAE